MFRHPGQRIVTYQVPGEGGAAPAAPAAPAAAPTSPWGGSEGVWSIGEGEAAQPWYSTIPEAEARAHVEAKGYKNPAELALANYSLTKMQRGDPSVIGVPGAEATSEDWNAFYTKLGRPEAATGYDFKFADGVKPADNMVEFARNTFHEAGLTPKQAQMVADRWNTFAGEAAQKNTTSTAETNTTELTALQDKWGAELDKNKAAGQRAVQALGLTNELIERVENQIGSAAIVELLASIGRKSDEGGFTGGASQGDPNNPETMTQPQAAARIASLQGDAEFQKKYTDRNHPGHAEALRMMERLFSKV